MPLENLCFLFFLIILMTTTVLQLGNHILTNKQIVPLLASYQLIPQLICEDIIDRAIESIDCTSEEIAKATQEFDRRWGFTSEEERETWRSQYGLNQIDLIKLITRQLRIEKFKQATWSHELPSYFQQRRKQLTQVIYSLIRTARPGIANELYFRIQEGEESFASLACEYSEGAEAKTGGLIGPVAVGTLHPILAQLLSSSPIGVVQTPVSLGEWQVIVRVERFIPAEFNDIIRQRLLQEKFEAWFKEQLPQLSHQDQIWMGCAI
jgi:parvulin-like peptidyl-prolyl isomerase